MLENRKHIWKKWKELIPNNLSVTTTIFSALQSRNYRLYFSGQCISLIGSWMQNIAMSWLIYRMTGDVVMLAMVSLLSQIPGFFMAPFTGVASDRFNKQKILVITQTLSGIEALALAGLTLFNVIEVWHILSLALFIGVVNAFDTPARQSIAVELVQRKEDLSNAIALNSASFNGARLIGPSIGGLLIGWVGEGWCFFINGISYIAVISALLAMHMKPRQKTKKKQRIWYDIGEGFRYVLGYMPLRALLIMIGVYCFFGLPFTVLVPAFVKDILGGESHTLGFLLSSFGAGALTAALYLAARKSVVGLGKVVTLTCGLFGLMLIAIAFIKIPVVAYIVAFPAGFGMIATIAALNTLLQSVADDDKRGRVMSFYAMGLMGMTPLGAMWQSVLVKMIGIPYTILISGVICVAAAGVFEYFRPAIRKAAFRGRSSTGHVVPEIAEGLQESSYTKG